MSHAWYRPAEPTMPRAIRADLDDLRTELAQIRMLPGVTERAAGVFWLRGTPFLHFHTRRPPRRVHAKAGRTWGSEIALPFGAGRGARAAFVREIRIRHAACLAADTARRAARAQAARDALSS